MTIILTPAAPAQPVGEGEVAELEAADAEAVEPEAEGWYVETKNSNAVDDIFEASFLAPLLADLNGQQQVLAKKAFEDWVSTAKARMEGDVRKMTQLIKDLASCCDVTTTASNPISPTPTSAETRRTQKLLLSPQLAEAELAAEHADDFVLLPLWSEGQSPSRRLSLRSIHSHRGLFSSREDDPILEAEPCCLNPFVMYPTSPRKMVWDLLGAALIVYDLLLITLQVFDPPDTDAAAVLNWVSLIFWTLNIPLSVITAFTKDGITIVDTRKILRRYLRTWFPVDFVVVGLDWSFTLWSVLTSDTRSAGSSVRLLRVLRLFRIARLARLLKLRSILQSFYDMIDSEYLGVITDICIMLMLLFFICHMIACTWFWIGTVKDGHTWIKEYKFEDVDWTYQYLTSFHWAITQFTPASMQVQPQNVTERSFAIVIVLFALVGFSYVVGSITGSLTQLRMMRENVSTQFWELRRYMRKQKVPLALSVRCQKYLEHVMETERKNMPAKKVKLLSHLSEQLKSELEFEICMPQLSVHPLFEHMHDISRVSMHRLANTAIEHRLLARTDMAFMDNEEATHMYFVARGRLDYVRLDSKGNNHPEKVGKGEDWIAEPVLWLKRWLHRGALQAVTECEVVLLKPRKFREVIRINPVAFFLASTYAKNFSAWIKSVDHDELSDIWQGHLASPRVRRLMEVDGSHPTLSLKSFGRTILAAGTRRSSTRDDLTSEASTMGRWSV